MRAYRTGTVVTINMVGILLKVCGVYFYLCPCCTGLRVWGGDGNDLHEQECTCWQFGGLRSALMRQYAHQHQRASALDPEHPVDAPFKSAAAAEPAAAAAALLPARLCLICRSKSICARASLMLPDVKHRVMRRINLCSRHALPDHILGTITSVDEFQIAYREYNASRSGDGHGNKKWKRVR
jgi:hypothetical protein